MKQIVTFTTLLLMIIFPVSCSSQSPNAQPQDEPVFSVSVKNDDDQVNVQYEDGTTVIEIKSPIGIGAATFQLETGTLPDRIVTRLHLAGLEEFRLVSEQVTLAASIPSSGGLNAQSQRIISGNGEQVLRSFDALWLDIEIVSDAPKIPLENGHFEIVIPKEFVQTSGGSFEIQWIDFFR